MSTKEQLDDNVSYMEHFEPLSDKEHEVLKTVVEKLNAIPTLSLIHIYGIFSVPGRFFMPVWFYSRGTTNQCWFSCSFSSARFKSAFASIR